MLRIGVGVGPTLREDVINTFVEMLVSEPVIGRKPDGGPTPVLAQSWAWSRGNRRLTVRLKPSIKLHNGKMLTAEVVARSLNDQVTRARATSAQAFDTIARISTEGGDLVVDLSKPDSLVLNELLSLRIVDPDAADAGTGPFRIVSRQPQPEMVRFEDYHKGVPTIEAVSVISYESQRSAWTALLRDEVDAVQEIGRSSVEFLAGSTNATTYSFLQPFYIPLVFNVEHPVLRDVEVRRAISEALDRHAIVDKAMSGLGRVADGPIWPFHWAYSAPTKRYGFAPASAVARLERAGFPLKRVGSDGIRRARLSFRCLFFGEDPQYERIALMIQRQLYDIGVDLVLEPATFEQFRPRARAGDFDSFLIRTNSSRALNIMYRFWRSTGSPTAPMQRSGYTGADAALDRLQQATSDQEVREAVSALSRRFYEDAPAAFIAWTEITRAVSSRFTPPDGDGEDPFATIWQWRPAGAPR